MMFPSDTVFGVFLVSQLCIGVPGNLFLFLLYMHTFSVQRHVKRLMDPIFSHLTLANTLTITFTLTPHIASSFGVRQFLDDVGCKTVLYVFRVTRGVSICTTSLLSAFQAITVSPRNSKWAWLKFKLTTWTCPFFLFFWVINMLIYIHTIETVTATRNLTLVGYGYVHPYCQTRQLGNHKSETFLSVILFHDLVFVPLMIGTSLYMVNLLYRHHRRAQHLHSARVSSQTSPEHKATRTILLLVSCFVVFYFSNNYLTLYSFYAHKKIPMLAGLIGVLSSCYPTICPFLLMKNNKIVSQFTSSFSQ
ncbi:vomeronasal type-1 receptor 4 [Ictidomys tridecemlineatus]|uniref:vomeronasal type-1 receptor 4-like n=1 Tax=Ictidomys tridecemlineatus TaxID=43179 RepID=UPI001A9D4C32|nr:vomeronasal type-1 receptor 4-like [Ictidomys tridecemlineatus]